MDDYYDTFYRFLSEGIYQIFHEEFNKSKIIKSSYNYLQNFQIVLQQIPLWTAPICEKKWEAICKLSGYECLEEYMKIVIVTKMKFLIEHCMEDEKEIDEMIENFRCPTKEDFLRDILSCCARYFYQNPFLFKQCSFEDAQENKKRAKDIIVENIKYTIQRHLPSKIIAKKCKPEELLKKKRASYSHASSQCDTLDGGSQMEKYYGHIGTGTHPRFTFEESLPWNGQTNHDLGHGRHPQYMRGQIDYPRISDSKSHAPPMHPGYAGHPNRMFHPHESHRQIKETRSPSPEYIRNAHNILYAPQLPGYFGHQLSRDDQGRNIMPEDLAYASHHHLQHPHLGNDHERNQKKIETMQSKRPEFEREKDSIDNSHSDDIEKKDDQSSTVSEREKTIPSFEKVSSSDQKNTQLTSSVPLSLNAIAASGLDGQDNVAKYASGSIHVNNSGQKEITSSAQPAQGDRAHLENNHMPFEPEEQKKSSDVITVSVPQYALDRVHSLISEPHSVGDSERYLDEEFSSQEKHMTQKVYAHALNNFGRDIGRTSPPNRIHDLYDVEPKHQMTNVGRETVKRPSPKETRYSHPPRPSPNKYSQQANKNVSRSESSDDDTDGSLLSIESSSVGRAENFVGHNRPVARQRSPDGETRRPFNVKKTTTATTNAINNSLSKQQKSPHRHMQATVGNVKKVEKKNNRKPKDQDPSAHTTELSSPDLMTTEEEEIERRRSPPRRKLFNV